MKTKMLLTLALSLSFSQVYAQFEEQVLNSDPIHVDGYLAEDKPVMDGELAGIRNELKKQKTSTQLNKEKSKDLGKLSQQTEKLLDSQEEYIESKIESTMAIKEFNKKVEENQKKLRCIMEESTDRDCAPYMKRYQKKAKEEVEVQEVKVQQAAPVNQTVAEAPSKPFLGGVKFVPFLGGTSFNGEKEQLEAKASAGLRVEADLGERFAVGVGFNYSSLSTEDFANSLYGNNNWNPGYYGFYGQSGREINFKTMGLDFYGKLFITKGERFRPYLRAGIGINRADLKYANNNSYNYYGYQFGNEAYKTTYVNGSIALGSDIMLTQNVGLTIEANYSRGLSGAFSSDEAKNTGTSPDQARLKELGDEIINANALSVFAGLVVTF